MDDIEIHPERARLEALVGFGEKRLQRARERQTTATREFVDARSGLLAAIARLVDWLEANPDPQLPLPLTAAPKPTGDHQ